MYQLMSNGRVRRLDDGATIPLDEEAGDWQIYKAWLDEGNTPLAMNEAEWRAPMMTDLRGRRDQLLQVLTGLQSDYLADGDTSTADLLRTIKQGLKDLPALPAIKDAVSAAELKAAAKTAYAGLVAPAPLSVKTEFARYLG